MYIKMDDNDPDVRKIKEQVKENSIFGGFADITLEKDLRNHIVILRITVCMNADKLDSDPYIFSCSESLGSMGFVFDNESFLDNVIKKIDHEIFNVISKQMKIMKCGRYKFDRFIIQTPKKEE